MKGDNLIWLLTLYIGSSHPIGVKGSGVDLTRDSSDSPKPAQLKAGHYTPKEIAWVKVDFSNVSDCQLADIGVGEKRNCTPPNPNCVCYRHFANRGFVS